ncbi:hypothetical protein [Bordetella hinzii]|uniref:hypothetical protein n=1 Tax=Bordetella hinzii TaxID=103855 RepID=UPI001C016B34|nr:hypothetical protein [Bordetella hinzii]QWF40082.1 hypothetical protein HHA25_18295 [Bordetella hinzii]QWF44627.1 hypothetical protein HHA24_18285 [Bordetella hinzii]QWF49164.1 hypothetical protein HHA23_18285 [Bordetella hinzii]QWF53700.1 hypothetical protein HHA22_18290 [Bordetella hinzii]QWF58190.1 hypothetical protein HHA21_18045 [Bordetella hinzii]
MTKSNFQLGADVYNAAGAVASYVGPAPHLGHVVLPCYEYDDEEPHYGEPEIWPEVFASPPREKLAGDLAELHQEIKDAREQLEAVLTKVAEADRTKVILEREAAKNPDLAPLALWLSGEAKFAVILGGDNGNQFYTSEVRAGKIPDVFKSEDRDHNIRLVSFYWEPEAEHRYSVRIARYSDGSGGKDRRVFLGRTQQEAMDAAAAHVAEQQKFHQNDYHYPQIGVWLEHFGYGHMINASVRKAMEEYEAKARINRAKSARDQLARAEAALAAARDELQKTEQAA